MIFEFSRQAVKVFSKILLHEIPSSAIRVIPRKIDKWQGNDEGHKAAELMTKLTVAAVQ